MGSKTVNIKVIIHSEEPGDFDLEADPPLPKGPGKNEFIFENNGYDGFRLNYILDGNALGYFFPDDLEEALYSAKGSGCPKSKAQWDQFEAKRVKQGNKVLVVRNRNEKAHKGVFGYTLRVTKTPHDPNPQFLDLDPGGENRNGQTLTGGWASVMVGVASAVATIAACVIALSLAGFELVQRGG